MEDIDKRTVEKRLNKRTKQTLAPKRYRRLFYRIFLVCVGSVILFESFLFFPIIHRRTTQIYRADRQYVLNELRSEIENFYGNFCGIALKISMNGDLLGCFFPSADDAAETESCQRLKNYTGFNDVYSIYIYNEFQGRVYSSERSSASDLEQFEDREALELVRKGFDPSRSNFMLYYRPMQTSVWRGATVQRNTFTLVFYPYGNTKIAVILNSSPDYMQEFLRDNRLSEEGVFAVTDGDGTTLFTTNRKGLSVDVDELNRSIADDAAPESVAVQGETCSLFYTVSRNSGYRFLWVIPQKGSADYQIFSDILFLFAVTLLVFLVGTLVMVFGVRRVSTPFEKLLSRMQRMEKSLPLAKDGALKKTLNTALTPKEWEAMKSFSPVFTADRLFLTRICIDRFGALEHMRKASDRELYQYGMTNICKELFERHTSAEALVDSPDSILMIAASFPYETTLRDCQRALKDYLETSVTFVVSDSYPPSGLSEAYEQLAQLMKYRFVASKQAVITSQSFQTHAPENYDRELALIRRSLTKKDAETLGESLRSVTAKAAASDPTDARLCFIQIAMMFLDIPLYFSRDFDGNALLQSITTAETVDDACALLLSVAEGLQATETEQDGGRRKEASVRQCEEMIERDYANKDLNVSYLAERLQLTPFYLGKIFNEAKKTKLSAYITDVRLEHARERLETSGESVRSVADAVGFSSAEYFAVCFKKKYGFSPSWVKENGQRRAERPPEDGR